MSAPELCKSFSCRMESAFLEVLNALPDTFLLIGRCRDIQEAQVGFGGHEIALVTEIRQSNWFSISRHSDKAKEYTVSDGEKEPV